jgi:hypothetical protein
MKKPKLKPRDRQIIQFKILEDKSNTEIAKELDVTTRTVTRAFEKDKAKEYADELQAKREKKHMEAFEAAYDIIMDATIEAVQEMRTLMKTAKSERVRGDNAYKIACMGGLKPREDTAAGKTPKLVIEEKEQEAPKKEIKSA